jgi:crossover junction endodeoxyribonuclease RusA
MTAVIHIAISRDVLLTSNQRLHWATKARHTKVIRDMAWILAKHSHIQPMEAAELEVEATWPNRSRKRDSHNLQPTAKAAIDGFVDAGLLPDDSDKHLRRLTFTSAEETRSIADIAVHLKFTFTEVSA